MGVVNGNSSPLLVMKDALELLAYLCVTVEGASFVSLAKFQHGY